MPWYRMGEPGEDLVAHVRFTRNRRPSGCRAPKFAKDKPDWGDRCGRISAALCDASAGLDLAGKPQTCDMPLCDKHRTKGGPDVDYCPRHAHLAPAPLPLGDSR